HRFVETLARYLPQMGKRTDSMGRADWAARRDCRQNRRDGGQRFCHGGDDIPHVVAGGWQGGRPAHRDCDVQNVGNRNDMESCQCPSEPKLFSVPENFMLAGIRANGCPVTPARPAICTRRCVGTSITRRGPASDWRADYFTPWHDTARNSIANNCCSRVSWGS